MHVFKKKILGIEFAVGTNQLSFLMLDVFFVFEWIWVATNTVTTECNK